MRKANIIFKVDEYFDDYYHKLLTQRILDEVYQFNNIHPFTNDDIINILSSIIKELKFNKLKK
ncbi:hypothetical protein M0P65_07860 [Candidatus Gracilibacteria bacterium]|jgi:hypothetical protein|nr:hypothetical protein [Candidatus Gracilibacteria bacterium]